MTASMAETGERFVASPEDFHRTYVEAFNSGSVEPLVSLYESDAALVPEPEEVVSGHAAIREALSRYQTIGRMTATTRYCITSGEVALASASWQIDGTGPDGRPVSVAGTSADLLRRQGDGRWLLVVDHPFGGMKALAPEEAT
jgi:ketosteroid isomerase-like protein